MWYVRLLLGLGVEVLLIISVVSLEDSHFWNAKATDELNTALKIKWNEGIAKNVIIFVGDGMGITTITASRIYKGGESHKLTFEQFPHIGLLKTYVVNKQVPDSASTATSLFCGVKNNYETVGVDSSVSLNDCKTSLEKEHQLDSIMKWAQTAGKDTGFVTTTRVTHATPSALYAHVPNRRWECDAKIPAEAKDCKDIGRQLVEDEPGRSIKVIMGGGLQILKSNSSSRPGDPIDNWACKRADGKDLIQTWIDLKKKSGVRYKFLSNSQDVHTLDADNTDYVLGVFANGHMNMEHARNKTPDGMPSLEDMTLAAVKVLQKNRNGFLLMVEGGMIDFAHHRGHARMALDETVAFDQAINSTMKWLEENQILESTLVITTSDHDHALSMTGYPDRGSNILGIASKSKITGVPYTTLTYSTGEYKNYQYSVETNNSTQVVRRMDPSKNDTTAFTYSQQTGILTDEALHGGGDVAIYATGPMAHLFHNVHEQNYVAHVVAYAAKIGPYKSGASINSNITIMILLMFIFWKVFLI